MAEQIKVEFLAAGKRRYKKTGGEKGRKTKGRGGNGLVT
jgi:hypothetical protein